MMTILNFVAALAITTIPAFAQLDDFDYELCQVVEELAEQVMSARQEGISQIQVRQVLMPIAEEADLVPLIGGIITGAYNRPMFSSDTIQQREILEFKDAWANFCLSARAGG